MLDQNTILQTHEAVTEKFGGPPNFDNQRNRKINCYRTIPIPLIYTQLDFIRVRKEELYSTVLFDYQEELDLRNKVKLVASGKEDLSLLEGGNQLIIKCEFADDILNIVGNIENIEMPIFWTYYYWKIYDIESLFPYLKPDENKTVSLNQAGIEKSYLDSIADKTSCIPLLRNVEKILTHRGKKGYSLSKEVEIRLREEEKRMMAFRDIERLKGIRPVKRIINGTGIVLADTLNPTNNTAKDATKPSPARPGITEADQKDQGLSTPAMNSSGSPTGRELQNLRSLKQWEAWRAAAREYKKNHPKASDREISRHIAKLPIANGASPETIRKHIR